MKTYISFIVSLICLISFSQDVLLDENFKDGLPDEWTVETSNDYRKWQNKSYKNMDYIQMSAYGGKGKSGVDVVTTLFSPILSIEDRQCRLRFNFADAFTTKMPLRVFIYSEDKKKIKALEEENWEHLFDNSDFYDNKHQSSEWINLPQIKQPYSIGFEYNSENGSVAGTVQLSEVKIWCD